VAEVASITTLDVVLWFSKSDGVVMAAGTVASDLLVINTHGRSKSYDRVAIFADITRLQVP